MSHIILKASEHDHKGILAVAKQSPFTRDFSNHIFSGPLQYAKGWIRVRIDPGTGVVVGFTCVRHKVRSPETVLYFIGVDKSYRGKGIGAALMADLKEQSPHRTITLNVMKTNKEARAMYDKLGFRTVGESLGGDGLALRLDW